jgi:hypothetical protein
LLLRVLHLHCSLLLRDALDTHQHAGIRLLAGHLHPVLGLHGLQGL